VVLQVLLDQWNLLLLVDQGLPLGQVVQVSLVVQMVRENPEALVVQVGQSHPLVLLVLLPQLVLVFQQDLMALVVLEVRLRPSVLGYLGDPVHLAVQLVP
jgi:hypothetical protein